MTLSKSKSRVILSHEKGWKLDFIKKVWQLTILKVSPEALPYNHTYLLMGLGLNFLLAYIVTIFLPIPELKQIFTPMTVLLMKVANLFFLAMFLHIILRWAKKSERFFKLYLAIVFGTLVIEVVNFVISLIPSFLKNRFDFDLSTNFGLSTMFSLVTIFTIIWVIMFIGHIFRYGLEVTRLKGVLIAIGYILVSGLFSTLIFGNPFQELL